MESIINQDLEVGETGNALKRDFDPLAWILGISIRLLRRLHGDQRGFVGMEGAILMVTLVVASTTLGAAYMNSSLHAIEEVEQFSMQTIDSLIEQGGIYIELEKRQIAKRYVSGEQQARDLAPLENALASALDAEVPRTIELQPDGTAAVTIELSAAEMTGLPEVVAALELSLGAEFSYTVEVSGEKILLKTELQPPLVIETPDVQGLSQALLEITE